ncbi:MAG TPA: non-heme iron oxygenase ferredoxin subunit, partial [Jiangellaceae bacterium]|nr:non-heme iron oxygenase ferredoxin subunit [Jiangellaceae bacterium]
MSSYALACAVAEVPDGGALCATVVGVDVALIRMDGEIHAVSDTCSHEQVSLSEGEVDDGEIECWQHGSRFDLRSGQPTSLPATEPIAVYPVKIDGDDVLVDVANPVNSNRL